LEPLVPLGLLLLRVLAGEGIEGDPQRTIQGISRTGWEGKQLFWAVVFGGCPSPLESEFLSKEIFMVTTW